MRYIILYADDYDHEVWKEYCDVCDVDYDETYIKIKFKVEDVEAGNDVDED